jgi:hypothetical protein
LGKAGGWWGNDTRWGQKGIKFVLVKTISDTC